MLFFLLETTSSSKLIRNLSKKVFEAMIDKNRHNKCIGQLSKIFFSKQWFWKDNQIVKSLTKKSHSMSWGVVTSWVIRICILQSLHIWILHESISMENVHHTDNHNFQMVSMLWTYSMQLLTISQWMSSNSWIFSTCIVTSNKLHLYVVNMQVAYNSY